MTHLAVALRELGDKSDLNDTGLGRKLHVHKTVISRMLSGQMDIGRESVSRLLINLDAAEARALLQAHFTDELERIRSVRDEKAAELGLPVADPGWPHTVKVGKKASPPARGEGA